MREHQIKKANLSGWLFLFESSGMAALEIVERAMGTIPSIQPVD